jgi:hypothetical protein
MTVVAILLSGAVVLLNCELVVPRQGWSEKWGPLVPHRSFPDDCGLCHVSEAWDVLRPDFAFDHEKETGHALEGAHSDAACLRCHNDRGPVQVYVARGCGGCHVDPHKSSLGLDCSRCHEQIDWEPRGLIAEHSRTRFPLVGAHSITPCEACHLQAPIGDFRGAPTACALCHQQDLARATSPDHLASGWVTSCERCHTPVSWTGAGFTHDIFPLAGGHGGLECTQCHTSGRFDPIPPDCISCHLDDYQRAPDHVALSYPRDCRLCHSISDWQSAVVRHDFFPLTGGHAGLDCVRCHTSGTFTPLPTDCYACHQSDYERAPDHVEDGFPRDCTRCHNTAEWD